MRFHRAISVLVLTAFLPLAVGCSSRNTITLESDPTDTSLPTVTDEPLDISGYSTVDGEEHSWNGQVQTVGTDSLAFTRTLSSRGANSPPSAASSALETIHIERAQVASVFIKDMHVGRSIALVFGLYVVFIAGIAAATYEHGTFLD